MFRPIRMLALALAAAGAVAAQDEKPLLLQKPAVSRTRIAFVYAGDIWAVGRDGGDAVRLTTGPGIETDPVFSPDGEQVAFTGEYDGNTDVYVVPAAGGVPRRLTYHPSPDLAMGWAPNGKRVLFASTRNSYAGFRRMFTLPLEGGLPEELPLPMADEGRLSPDGGRLAYVPTRRPFTVWKRYRGGQTTPIWLVRLEDGEIEKIPRQDSNDFNPMWVGTSVYFLSDRAGPVGLFAYDTVSKRVSQVVRNTGLDIKSAGSGEGEVVFEQFGKLYLYDVKAARARRLEVRVTGDLPGVRPRLEKAAARIQSMGLSPTGARAVFEARGDIFTVPAEKGDARNLTGTPGIAERYPAWSPDGRWIAYFSDASGEYELHLREQSGMGETRTIALGNPPSYYYTPVWSPDSKKIAYTDKRLTLWWVDLDKGTPTRVDATRFDRPDRSLDPVWSPDSRWLAYTKELKNRMHAVFAYSLETAQVRQITDGLSDARYPVFDKGGRYLYFAASTDIGPTTGWIDMSGYDRPVTRSVYLTVLRADDPSPLAPESDEEKVRSEPPGTPTPVPPPPGLPSPSPDVRIDFDGIDQRILALPIPPRSYAGLDCLREGVLLLGDYPTVMGPEPPAAALHKFELKTRKTETFLSGVDQWTVSANGEKLLYRQKDRFALVATTAPPGPGAGSLRLDGMEAWVDPQAEWRQMYREVWRIERDFFYDPGHHGLDLKAAEARYSPYLEGIAHRSDLNYLFQEMLGELSVGHVFVGGGDIPEVKRVPGGLLGADYRIENGRYRVARVYGGENWNPKLQAPLTQPGVNVKAGEYLLAVNGRELRAADNVYRTFEATAGRQVRLRVGPNPDPDGSREVTVVPIESERGLRSLAWVEGNRRETERLSEGRLAYVYLPDTAGGGFTNFNRYFFAQVGKEGAVIDERFNGGGSAADYIIDYLRRPLLNYWATREGEDFPTPAGAVYGPKAMIINELAGSGGDLLPWYFRRTKLGPLIGKRTWGGLVGVYDYPPLVDGGTVTAPRLAFYNPDTGEWEVENRGVPPDIEVELDPKSWRAGKDPQLERAVAVVLEALKKNPLPAPKRPKYPNYHPAAARRRN